MGKTKIGENQNRGKPKQGKFKLGKNKNQNVEGQTNLGSQQCPQTGLGQMGDDCL